LITTTFPYPTIQKTGDTSIYLSSYSPCFE
jgi:hypothetical protein